jgi:predicted ribosome quality control (RQC) complex YloA/Tae2 family protein
MSLKGVELQIAIPKTFDAGKMADQRQQAVLQQQMHATEEAKREFEKKRTVVIETDNLGEIREDDERQAADQQANDKRKKNKEQAMEKVKAQHPFKGNFFDFSG